MEEIVISGNQVVLRNLQEVKRTSTEAFYEALSDTLGIRTPILPRAVVYYASRQEHHLYVTHQEPREMTLRVRDGARNTAVHEYAVKLPHMYFFHHYVRGAFEQLHLLCAPSALEKISDRLHKLPVKNLYSDGAVCLGNDLRFSLSGRLDGKLARTETYFWESVFNADLDHIWEQAIPKEFRRAGESPFAVWQELSQGEFDPAQVSWVEDVRWSELVDRILGVNP